jgi:hypothetical protein
MVVAGNRKRDRGWSASIPLQSSFHPQVFPLGHPERDKIDK